MPAGRPTKYDPALHPRQAYELSLLGFSNERMAAFFGIDETTFYRWQEEYPELRQEVTRGKEPSDGKVAVGFYQRAAGYEYQSEKIVTLTLPDGGGSEYVRVPITVHVPPDPGAALNWLKNRQPELWRDKKQLDLGDAEGNDLLAPVVRIFGGKPKEQTDGDNQ